MPNSKLCGLLSGLLIIIATFLNIMVTNDYTESQDAYQKIILVDADLGTANSEMSRFLLEYQLFNDSRAYMNYLNHKENFTEHIDNNETVDSRIIGLINYSQSKFKEAGYLSTAQMFVLALAFVFAVIGYNPKR
jgi:hypothetical protein